LLQYEGWANSASNPQPSQPVWAIKQYTYDGNNRLVLEQWANGSSQRTNVWDNCATLSYE
jgi:YD repeat-containing protein